MKIVFDMDNTLADEQGKTLRPGIKDLLRSLYNDNNEIVLWTNSPKSRALDIIRSLEVEKYFSKIIGREDYDPKNHGLLKKTHIIKADRFIDDDIEEIEYNKKNGISSLHIKPYRKNMTMADDDIPIIENFIYQKDSPFKKAFKIFRKK